MIYRYIIENTTRDIELHAEYLGLSSTTDGISYSDILRYMVFPRENKLHGCWGRKPCEECRSRCDSIDGSKLVFITAEQFLKMNLDDLQWHNIPPLEEDKHIAGSTIDFGFLII